jgi:ketosteroid isomerase-like protein
MRKIIGHMQSSFTGCIAIRRALSGSRFRAPTLSKPHQRGVPGCRHHRPQPRHLRGHRAVEVVASGQIPEDVPDVSPTFGESPTSCPGCEGRYLQQLAPTPERPVINGDVVAARQGLKRQSADADILLACGPNTLTPLLSTPGLVDEYVIAVHPAVLAARSQLFGHLSHDLALELVDATAFDGGVVVLRHRVIQPYAAARFQERIAMTTPRQIAEAFSGHRFKETYGHLAPDVQWILVGSETIDGRDRVIDTCEQTLAELADTATDFLRFLTIADEQTVAVDTVGRYRSVDGETSIVASCDIYQFRQGVVATITSYTVELTRPHADTSAG